MQNAVHIYKGNIVGASSGGGGSSDPAVFTITVSGYGTQENPYVADKTPAEVEAAYNAGKVIHLIESKDEGSGEIFELGGYSSNSTGLMLAFDRTSVVNEYGAATILYLLVSVGSERSAWTTIQNHIRTFSTQNYITSLTPGPDYEGLIFQNTGASFGGFEQGYFYKCVSDGGSPATYSWQQINVQPSSGGSDVFVITITGEGTQADPYMPDKTPAEVAEAYDSGKVMRLYDGTYYDLIWVQEPTQYTGRYYYFEYTGVVDPSAGIGSGTRTLTYYLKVNTDNTTWQGAVFETTDFLINSGTTDLTPGTSPLSTGSLYVVYE